jgi:general secretion pathway protein D
MPKMNRLSAALLVVVMLGVQMPVSARTRKGDKLLAQGKAAEAKGELDKALQTYEAALAEDPTDPAYLLYARRVRFLASEKHIKDGQKIRSDGHLTDALVEFQRAYAIDPASTLAQQEIRRTKEMIERERRKANGQPEEEPPNPGLTPSEVAQHEENVRIDSLQNVPELRPLNSKPIDLKMNGQKPRVLFETVGKIAGINVLFDPEYEQQNATRPQSVDLTGSTLQQSLDYIALLTKSYWKPLSANAIFVTVDNPTKRRDFEEMVVKVFYLKNIVATTELQELLTTLRTVTDIQKIYQYTSQSALIVRCAADKMLLAEKIIHDLDKPRNEVIVDVIVMEVTSDVLRNLATQLAPGGFNSAINFNPTRAKILGNNAVSTTTTAGTTTTATGTTTTGTDTTGTTGTGTTTTTTPTGTAIPLSNFNKISSGDFSITGIPGALIEATMSDSGTRVLQTPQLRATDQAKVSLHIGDKVPTASGSFGSSTGSVGVGISPLVQTQFTYIETGVNMDMLSKVHDANQVTLDIQIDISQVTSYRDVGGISQPVISQRKISQNIRTQDGEINLIGGLMQEQDSYTKNGTPGLSSIPLLGRLFTGNQTEKVRDDLVIVVIPHIVRSPDITESNLRGVATGSEQNVHMIRSIPLALPAETTAPAPAAGPAPPAGAPPVTAPATAPQPPQPSAAGPPAPPATISFLPVQATADLGSALTVTLRAENATELKSLLAQLKFDPKILRINSVAAADLIQQTGPPLTPSKNILNDTGDATVTIARDPAGPGVSGSGGLFTVVFQAVGKGTTTVALQQLTLRAVGDRTIPSNTPSLTVTVK